MKLEQNKQIAFHSNTSFDGYDATISAENMGKLWDMLQNPYKNPIGALIREYVSNSFDSHAEAEFIKNHTIEEIKTEFPIYKNTDDEEIKLLKEKVSVFNNDPVKVTLGKDETGQYWATEDVGVGLSPSRIKDVFVSYLKSTKELSNNVIGAFGIGSKSGLSYADVVFIRTRYNNVEYYYMLRKGENGPRLDIIGEEETTEKNGTEIKIYLNNYDDSYNFKIETEKQLAYFDNVYYEGFTNIYNDFEILQGDNWITTTAYEPQSDLHICLGKVSYPIDWKIIEHPRIGLNVALKFDIGELDVIQTREDIKYTPRTKEAILKKIALLKEEFETRYEAIDKECKTLIDYWQKRNDSAVLTFDTKEGRKTYHLIDITDKFSSDNGYYYQPFVDAGITKKQLPVRLETLFFDYYFSGSFKHKFQSFTDHVTTYWLEQKHRGIFCYRIQQEHDTKKSRFIQSTLHYSYDVPTLRFVRKRTKLSLKNYKTNLKLDLVDKSLWRKQIICIQKEIQKHLISILPSYDKEIPTEEWLQSIKKVREKRDTTEFKVEYWYGRGITSNLYKDDSKQKIENFENKTRSLFLVGIKEQFVELNAMFKCYQIFTKTPTKFLDGFYIIAPTNIKKLKNVKNMQTVETFISDDNTVFKKMMSYLRFKKKYGNKIKNFHKLMRNNYLLQCVNPKMFDDFKKLDNIITDLLHLEEYYTNKQIFAFLQSCYKTAEENNLFDDKLEEEWLTLINQSEKFSFLQYYSSANTGYAVDSKAKIKDLALQYMYLYNKNVSKEKQIPMMIIDKIYMKGIFEKKVDKVIDVKQEYLLPV